MINPESSNPAAMSARLREFVAELPLERESIVVFVRRAAESLPAGSRVLDAGAGEQPYRELFAHCDYVTADWESSHYGLAKKADIVGPLDNLPVADDTFDAVLCTQVIEHVPAPGRALSELHRILKPGGQLWLSAPLVWPLHEEPYDYFRYTGYGLRTLLEGAGFTDIEVDARTGYFTTMAMMLYHAPWALAVDERRLPLRWIMRVVRRTTKHVARLDRFDRRNAFPLGYVSTSRKPA